MNQFAVGIILYLLPGVLPAYVRYRCDNKRNRFSLAVNALQYAFLILVGTSGIMWLLFGDALFLPEYNPYLLLYICYFVAAYAFSSAFCIMVLKRYRDAWPNSGRVCLLAFSMLWVILLTGIFYDDYARKHIVINEVCSHNLSLVVDDDGRSSDYIELYNPSFTSVSLEGWYLADRENVDDERCMEGLNINPRSYLLLFADGTGRGSAAESDERQYGYLGFKIKEQGETLILADNSGHTIDRVDVPALAADISYARSEDGADTWEIVRGGTPGRANRNLTSYVLPTLNPPVFSTKSGFYLQPFELTLSAREGEKIYYTVDGSNPTVTSELYTAPFMIQDASSMDNSYADIENIARDGDYQPSDLIDKGTVVKAVCVNESGETSEVVSQVYFVGFDEKDGYDRVKIASVEGDPDDFFSEDRGIYVLGDTYQDWIEYGEGMGHSFAANYTRADKTGERPVTITLFDKEKNLIDEEKIGIRIRGGASRNLRQKGFNFYVRDEYGEDPLGLCAKMLRTSGSIDTNVTMLRDVFNQSLVADRHLDTQPGEPCMVFLNGEFWGLYNLQTRFTEGYFEERYDIEEDNLILIKQDKRVSIGEDADMALYTELESYARERDLSQPENYETISRMMDIQSFIDHYCFEIYIGNADWPRNNVCCWRSRTNSGDSEYTDGRWRWGIYDTDESTGIYKEGMGTYSSNAFLEESHWFGSPLTTPLMSNLIENEEFKQQFTVTFLDMVNKNFAYPLVHDKLYEMAVVYAEPMVKSYNRYNEEEYTSEDFWSNISVIDEYYEKRADYIIPYFAEALNLSGAEGEVTLQTACAARSGDGQEMVTELSADGGSIIFNTITPDMERGEWKGRYLTDYPVTATAQAADGYRFAGWQGTYESSDETIEAEVLEEGICLRAVFEPVK